MSSKSLKFFNPFLSKKRTNHIGITIANAQSCAKIIDNLDNWSKAQISEQGFTAKSGQIFLVHDKSGQTTGIIAGVKTEPTYEDGASIYNAIKGKLSKEAIEHTSFEFNNIEDKEALERLHISWGWAAYSFNLYKKPDDNQKSPTLVITKDIDKKRIKAFIESICLIRDLVNIPANDMGPDELEDAMKFLCENHKLDTMKVIKDKSLLTKNFPMIHAVGKGSSRRPRLLEFSWGNPKHPHIALVGKGVCFDTGGLDIKPSQFMLTMKKDMGGAAHVLGLAHMIISLKVPVHLHVLIPAVENSISGDAYRPSDILDSRKGLSVEVGDTDAEGRLVLADTLTYACESSPELLIDFATLTGAARIALGHDLPAMFSTNDKVAYEIQTISAEIKIDDPVWHMPLWAPYKKELESPVADTCSTGGKAGAITAALFLQQFIDETKIKDWIHMDVFAWEQTGKTGRPKGGADTGMRAIFAYIENRFREKD